MQNVVFSANYATFSFLTDGAIVKPVRKHNITEKYLQHDLKIKIVLKKSSYEKKNLFCFIHNNDKFSKIAKIKKPLLHFLSLINLNEKC